MRHLPALLKAHFDSNLMKDGTPTEFLIEAAASCIGITEVGGDNKGPWVELFQATVSRPQGQSWCLDFLQACIAYVELSFGIQSPLPATELCLDLWNQSKNYHSVIPPRPGDLILWQFGDTLHGHVGLILGEDSLRYKTVEGNTSDSIGIDANGDGVYLKYRAKGGSKTFHQLGFLRAFP